MRYPILLIGVVFWSAVCCVARAQESPPPTTSAPVVVQAVPAEGDAPKVMVAPQGDPRAPGGMVPPGARPSPDRKPPGAPGMPGQPGSPEGDKPGAKPEDAAKPDTIKRPDKPPVPANPEELKVRPDQDGQVRFQFRGQSWPDVLEWFGEISGMSVDWQELPGDYLNIATQRGYKVEEIRDLLNRLLLARGFTMLQQDEVVIVVKCDQLSVGLVPRVDPAELDTLLPHQYVRVMFHLDWILADEASKELEPLLSKNGKLFPLATTNRIEAMDAVVNLRELYRLIKEEQNTEDGEPRLVREFVLEFARADDVKEQLLQLLGESTPASMPTRGMTPQQMAQQQQMMMQQMQAQMRAQQRAQSGQPQPSSSRSRRSSAAMPNKPEPVRMIVSRRRNSILVQAPPDKMAVIADAIKLLDVSQNGPQSLQAFLGRMQVYRLAQLDPKKLVESLQELGGLDPTTRLEVDEANRAIIAYASPADHFTIRSTIEKLDGSARRVEVIPLRRLAADEVAGTIQYLMAGTGNERSSRPDYMDYIYGYSYSRRNRSQETNSSDQFRVDADVANNRLLVRANETELEEVVDLLVKLGEVPPKGPGGGLTRVLDVVPGDDAAEFLHQLEQNWKAVAPNPLIMPKVEPKPKTEQSTPAESTPSSPAATPAAPAAPAVTESRRPATARRSALHQAALWTTVEEEPPADRRESPAPDAGQPDSGPAPIIVSIGPDGRLVLASKDPAALAMLEELAMRTAPPRKDYEIFHLKNALASWVILNLEEFFEDEDATDNRRRSRVYSYIYGMPSSSQEDGRRLSQRRPLKFISDLDTNTILVQGADPEQLKTIAELIKLYDVPEPVNSQTARVTKLFTIKYSRASIVANVIKDAYRDLLSSNDRALQESNRNRQQQPQRGGGGMTIISPFGFGEDQSPADTRTSARFEGKLSIGVDEVSNTLLVSTEGDSLMQMVSGMIEAIDESAKPASDVRVVTLHPSTDGSQLSKALSKVLGGSESAQPSPPAPQTPEAAGNGPPGMPPGPPPRARSRR